MTDALGVGRQLEDLVAAIGRRERFDPVRVIGRKVLCREQPTALLQIVGNGLADGTSIEGVAAALGNLLKRGRERRILEHLAGGRRLACRQEDGGAIGIAGQQIRDLTPLPRDDLADAVAVTRIPDGGLERLRERDRAVLGQQLVPAVHHAGDAHRQRPAQRNTIEVPLPKFVERRGSRRASARVEAVDGLRFRVVERSRTGPRRSRSSSVRRRTRTAAAVTAASMALPPDCRTLRPAAVASGWLVAMAPFWAITTDLVARVFGAGRSPGSCGVRAVARIIVMAAGSRMGGFYWIVRGDQRTSGDIGRSDRYLRKLWVRAFDDSADELF